MAQILRSRLLGKLGIRHGFNLRAGGTSEGAYASLNLGRAVGDVPEHVEENHRRFATAVGYAHGSLFESSQVHGAAVQQVQRDSDLRAVRGRDADALVAGPGAIAIGVRVADCVPVLLYDTQSGAVSAIHAGWRGTVRGVVESALYALLGVQGAGKETVVAAVFPHIRRCCFEVGEDVAEELRAAAPGAADVIDRSRSKPHVDLGAIIAAKLEALGVRPADVELLPGCTRCEPERFFSFRRDGQRSGRHLAAIVSR